MNFKHSNRIAEFFGDVAQFENKNAVAVFQFNELAREFNLENTDFGKFTLVPRFTVCMNDMGKIDSHVHFFVRTEGDNHIFSNRFERLVSPEFTYKSDYEPVKFADFNKFKKAMSSIFFGSTKDLDQFDQKKLDSLNVLQISNTADFTIFISYIHQISRSLRFFKSVYYGSKEEFLETLSNVLYDFVGVMEPEIYLIAEDKKHLITLQDDRSEIYLNLIPVYRNFGWACFMPHSVLPLSSAIQYDIEADFIPKMHLTPDAQYSFNFRKDLFGFLNSILVKSQVATIKYDHSFTETLRIFNWCHSLDVYQKEIMAVDVPEYE